MGTRGERDNYPLPLQCNGEELSKLVCITLYIYIYSYSDSLFTLSFGTILIRLTYIKLIKLVVVVVVVCFESPFENASVCKVKFWSPFRRKCFRLPLVYCKSTCRCIYTHATAVQPLIFYSYLNFSCVSLHVGIAFVFFFKLFIVYHFISPWKTINTWRLSFGQKELKWFLFLNFFVMGTFSSLYNV